MRDHTPVPDAEVEDALEVLGYVARESIKAERARKVVQALASEVSQLRERVTKLEGALRSVSVVLASVPDEHRRWDASLPEYVERLADGTETEK